MKRGARSLWMLAASWLTLWTMVLTAPIAVWAQEPPAADVEPVTLDDPLPYGLPPVDYESPQSEDRFARLGEALAAGRDTLRFDAETGYLTPLLEAVDVSSHSQLLVFSKTALNVKQVAPDNPRAVYFNDDTYIAWVPGAEVLELAALDPVKGAVFYTLAQNSEQAVRFERQGRCLACHVSNTTDYVPGPMIRSFQTDATGRPRTGYSELSHTTEFFKRWGGWYVTGELGALTHSGNIFGEELIEQRKSDPEVRRKLSSLAEFFDQEKHLLGSSDVLPHLVLDHQIRGQNLILRAHHEALFHKRSDVEERLVRYLLFLDEVPLPAPVTGDADYREWFESRGPFDAAGRTLRRFDLQTRLFAFRCSYLIHTRLFDALPEPVRQRVAGRMEEILRGNAEESPLLPAEERAAILEILQATKPGLFR